MSIGKRPRAVDVGFKRHALLADAIFDGDYASLTFAHPDHALAEMIEARLREVVVVSPRKSVTMLARWAVGAC